jgi:hypothetical protein
MAGFQQDSREPSRRDGAAVCAPPEKTRLSAERDPT